MHSLRDGKISKLDIQIFLLEVFLTLLTCGLFPLILFCCWVAEQRSRMWEEEMKRDEAKGYRASARAVEWSHLRQMVRLIEAERCKTTS